MSTELIQILLALAPYVVPPLVALLVYLVKKAIDRLPANQRVVVSGIVRTSVAAADQLASDQLNGPGKRQVALEMIEAQLKHMHIDVPAPVVNALIEEAVLALHMARAGASQAVVPVPMPPAKEA
jgi:hypothetical protein